MEGLLSPVGRAATQVIRRRPDLCIEETLTFIDRELLAQSGLAPYRAKLSTELITNLTSTSDYTSTPATPPQRTATAQLLSHSC